MIRWTPRRKAELLTLIDEDPINSASLITLYELSPEELLEWRKALLIGLPALKATKLHKYQPTRAKRDPSKYTPKKPKPKQPKKSGLKFKPSTKGHAHQNSNPARLNASRASKPHLSPNDPDFAIKKP